MQGEIIMFIAGENNSDAIGKFVRSENTKSMAVAFIGAGLSKIINGNTNILCNLRSGATNPYEVYALCALPGVEVKNHSTLHAKVYISNDTLIVGSANLSTNGIGLEDEAAQWLEASIVSKNHKLIAEAQKWFDALWHEAENVTPEMLDKAKSLFHDTRNNRPYSDLNLHALRDRDYYCVIYKDNQLSAAADELMSQNIGNNWGNRGYGVYEKWGESLPKGTLIDYHLKKGKLRYTGTWKYDGYSFESNKTDVQVAKSIKKRGFTQKTLTQALENHLDRLWPNHQTEEAKVIRINDVLSALELE